MIRASLEELDLAELLRALERAKRNAVVTLQGRIYGRVHLLSGRLLYARTEPGPHLGEYLVRLGHLSLEEVQTLVEGQKENPGTPLGALALERGLIGKEELREALFAQVLEALATLLGEREGSLLAEPLEEGGSQVALPETLDLSEALLEAARRLDEWRRGRVGEDEVLRLVGDPTHHPLSPEAWALLELLDGVRRAKSVALLSGLPEEEVYHLLFELKSRGLLAESPLRPEDPLVLLWAESSLVRRLLLYILEGHRYRVLMAKDGESARRILKERPRAALLQGERLLEMVRLLRASPEGRFLPLFAVSEAPLPFLLRAQRVERIPRPFTGREVLKALAPIRPPL